MNPVNNNVNRITDEFRRTWGHRIGCLDIAQMKETLKDMEEDWKKQRDYESDKYYYILSVAHSLIIPYPWFADTSPTQPRSPFAHERHRISTTLATVLLAGSCGEFASFLVSYPWNHYSRLVEKGEQGPRRCAFNGRWVCGPAHE